MDWPTKLMAKFAPINEVYMGTFLMNKESFFVHLSTENSTSASISVIFSLEIWRTSKFLSLYGERTNEHRVGEQDQKEKWVESFLSEVVGQKAVEFLRSLDLQREADHQREEYITRYFLVSFLAKVLLM